MTDGMIHQGHLNAPFPLPSVLASPIAPGSDWREHQDQASAPLEQTRSYPCYPSQAADPSPSIFSSPTDTSPSASPYNPNLHDRRHSGVRLVLAETTPANLAVDPSDQSSGMSARYPYFSPPQPATTVPLNRPRLSLPYIVPSPPAPYSYPPTMHAYPQFGGAMGPGIHEGRRHTMYAASGPYTGGGSTEQGQDASTRVYGMPLEAYQAYGSPQGAAHMGHFSPEHQESVWTPRSHYEPYSASSSYPPPPPRQPQLLLGNGVSTGAPIVIDDPSLTGSSAPIVREEAAYAAPSHPPHPSSIAYEGSNPAFVQHHAAAATGASTPTIHTAPDLTAGAYGQGVPTPAVGYSNGTNVGTYTNQTMSTGSNNYGPFPPSAHCTVPPPQGAGETDPQSPPGSQDQKPKATAFAESTATIAAEADKTRLPSVNQGVPHAEGAGHEKQFDPNEKEVNGEDLSSCTEMVISDTSERARSSASGQAPSSHSGEAVGYTKETSANSNGPATALDESKTRSTQEAHSGPSDASESEGRHQHRLVDPSDATTTTTGAERESNMRNLESKIENVAVPSSQATAPTQIKDGRYAPTIVPSLDEGRVNGTGSIVDSPTHLVDEVNKKSRSAIKSPSPDESRALPPIHLHATTADQEAANIPEALTSSSLAQPSDIDRSYSLPLQPRSQSHSLTHHQPDMQAISALPYQHPPDIYPLSPAYSYQSRSQPHSSSAYSLSANSSLLHPDEWRRSSCPGYPTTALPQDPSVGYPRQGSLSTDDGSHGRSLSPAPQHRHSLPNVTYGSGPAPVAATLAGARISPPQATGYHTPGGRLVPAAFNNNTSSHGSASSASSTPPTAHIDASGNAIPLYKYDQGQSTHVPLSAQPASYGSPRDQKPYYGASYPSLQPHPTNDTYASRGREPYYGQYSQEYGYGSANRECPQAFDAHTRGPSSPVPPMVAGLKRGREDEWYGEGDRDHQRRRPSYAEPAVVSGMHYNDHSVAASPSVHSAQLGVIRMSTNYQPPSLKEMKIGSMGTNVPHPMMGNGRRAGDGAIRSGSDTSYSFISLPGNSVRKRPRRKFEEITRNYVCNWPGCTKAYGTLNHLNAHVTMQKHGPKRVPAEFKELRKLWRKQKREQQQREAMQRGTSEVFHDDEQGDIMDDDRSSVFNGVSVDVAQ